MDDFIIHGFEQVLRFSKVSSWGDLDEKLKVQLGFNMGVIAHGLQLAKEDGYQALSDLREGKISMEEFRKHILSLVSSRGVTVNQENVNKTF